LNCENNSKQNQRTQPTEEESINVYPVDTGYALYVANTAAAALNSEEQQKYWQAIETKFRELFKEE
jgi:hypothetical protein